MKQSTEEIKKDYLNLISTEKPVALQLGGSSPKLLAEGFKNW
jgi:tRNA-dihydrouridine synthase